MEAMDVETGAAALADERAQPVWHLLKRIGFRVSFVYIVLYYSYPLITAVPYAEFLVRWYGAISRATETFVGETVFHLGALAHRQQTGSGDTALDYVQLLIVVVLAIAGGVLWTALDRRRPHYVTLHGWLRVLARYALAVTLLEYGFAKIIPTQFSHLSPKSMLEPYGDSSPMGLLWNFMGYSTAYTVFAGLAEAVPAVLLLFRRTTLLGALLAAGVMLNVVMLNFCYDVPVKLFSVNLLLLALFLALPDARRLFALFVENRPVPRADLSEPRLRAVWLKRGAVWGKAAFVSVILFTIVHGQIINHRQFAAGPSSTPFSGLYRVEQFMVGGQTAPPAADALRWQRVLAAYPHWSWIWSAQGGEFGVETSYDPRSATVSYQSEANAGEPAPPWHRAVLHYHALDGRRVQLEGTLDGQPATVMLVPQDTSRARLTSRGFHWVQEFPFNR